MAPLALTAATATQPDIILVNVGTNDAVQPDMTDFQARYGTFVDQLRAAVPGVGIACARIGLSRAIWMANAETLVNQAVDAVVGARQATGRVVAADMTVIPQRWTYDGTHPLDAGYLVMAKQWTTAINAWLPT